MSTTKREVELELQLWREREMAVKNSAQSLNLQAQLLQHQARECQSEIARLEATLVTMAASAPAAKEIGHAEPGEKEAATETGQVPVPAEA